MMSPNELRRRIGGALFLLLILSFSAGAQAVKVMVQVPPPYPIHLEEYLSLSNQAVISLINTSQQSFQLKLRTTISGDNGIKGEIKPTWIPAVPISLAPFESKILTGAQLRDHFSNLTGNDLQLSGVDAQQIFRTGTLPEGHYEVCVQALELSTNLLVSDEFGCTSIFLTHYDPPVLLAPADGSAVQKMTPQIVHFTWTPTGIGGRTRYKLTLVDMTENGLFNPNDAFGPNIYVQPTFEVDDLLGTTFIYTINHPPLKTGHEYAVRVTAYDPMGTLAFKNGGKSPVSTFEYIGLAIANPNDKKTEGSQNPGNIQNPGTQTYSLQVCQDGPAINNNTPIAGQGLISVGDELQIGDHILKLTEDINWNGTLLSGKGKILNTWFHIPVLVEFDGLKVNSDKVVIDGFAKARDDNNSPIEWINDLGNISFGEQEVQKAIQKLMGESDKRIVEWPDTKNIGVGMPLGIERQIGGGTQLVAIVGMQFGPRGAALNAFCRIEVPAQNTNIVLGASGVCFDANGFTKDAFLWLAQDLTLGTNTPLQMKLLAGQPNTPPDGTYIELEKAGFKKLHLAGKVILDSKKVTPKPWNAEGVTASFEIAVDNFKNFFIGNLSLPNFEVVGLPGFEFEVQEVSYDHSELENPANIQWPTPNYTNLGNLWQGLYLKKVKVKLPAKLSEDAAFIAENILYDEFGFTGFFQATNLLGTDQGKMGSKKWPFSIDDLSIKILKNALTEGGFGGKIRVPIQKKDNYLNYSALLGYSNNKLTYQFTIQPENDIEFPVFIAKANLKNDTYIVVEDTGNGFEPAFHLYADVTLNTAFNASIQDIPLNFEGLTMQNVVVDKEGFHLGENGAVGFASPQKSFAGFDIGLNNFAIKDNGLSFGFDLDLAGENSVVGGECGFTIEGKWNNEFRLVYKDFKVDEIGIHGDVSIVKVDGKLTFYHNDPIYGRGFRGMIGVEIQIGSGGGLGIETNLLFGNKDGLKYFYIDGMVDNLPNPGVPITLSVSIYGFKGGVYFHMTKKDGDYVPDAATKFGLLAGAAIGLKQKDTFHAKVVLEANFTSSGLGQIGITGHGYVLTQYQPGFEKYTPAPAVYLGVSVLFDFPKKIFDAAMVAEINFPPQVPVITGGGGMHIYADPNKWWVKIGSSETAPGPDPIGLNVAGLFETKSYFMMGHELGTLPPPPGLVQQILGVEQLPYNRNNGMLNSGKGFAFGSSINFDTGDLDAWIFFARFAAGAGFDVMFASGAKCNGKVAGINGWYANGQAYAYFLGDVGLRFKFCKSCQVRKVHLVYLEAAALTQTGVPKPFWIDAYVAGKAELLGIFEGSFSFHVQYGDYCAFEPQYEPEDVVSGLIFIQDLVPKNQATDVSVFGEPAVLLTFSPNEDQTYALDQEDENGNTYKRYFRFPIKKMTLSIDDPNSPDNGKILAKWGESGYEGVFEKNQDGKKIKYKSDYVLPQWTRLKFEVGVKILELKNGSWHEIGSNDEKTQATVWFKTGQEPQTLTDNNIDLCLPGRFQRYYLQQDGHYVGYIKTKKQYKELFDLDNGAPMLPADKILVKFIPLDGGNPVAGTFIKYENNRILFSHPPLENGKMYALQLVKETSPTKWVQNNNPNANNVVPANFNLSAAPSLYESLTKKQKLLGELELAPRQHELYKYVFQTSRYNRLGTKVARLSDGEMLQDFEPNFKYPRIIRIKADEPFDQFEKDHLLLFEWKAEHPPAKYFNNYVKPKIYDDYATLLVLAYPNQVAGLPLPNRTITLYNPVPKLTQAEVDAKLAEPTTPPGGQGWQFGLNNLNNGVVANIVPPQKTHYLLFYGEQSAYLTYKNLFLPKLFNDHNPAIVSCFQGNYCPPKLQSMLEYHIQNPGFRRISPGTYRGLVGYRPLTINQWDTSKKYGFDWLIPLSFNSGILWNSGGP